MPGIISRIPLLNWPGFYGQIKGHSGGGEGFIGGHWTRVEGEGGGGIGGRDEEQRGGEGRRGGKGPGIYERN